MNLYFNNDEPTSNDSFPICIMPDFFAHGHLKFCFQSTRFETDFPVHQMYAKYPITIIIIAKINVPNIPIYVIYLII